VSRLPPLPADVTRRGVRRTPPENQNYGRSRVPTATRGCTCCVKRRAYIASDTAITRIVRASLRLHCTGLKSPIKFTSFTSSDI